MRQFISKVKKYWYWGVLLFGLTPLLWFWGKGNILINGVDTNFPLNPVIWFSRRFYVWTNVANGGTDFSSSMAGLFFHLVQTIPYMLGLSLKNVELISLVFWFSLIVLSSFLFAKSIQIKSHVAQIAFVVFYTFNTYLFNTWENVKVSNLALVAAIPLALALFNYLSLGKISRSLGIVVSLMIGVFLSGSGINPAYFITFFIVLFIYFGIDWIMSPHERQLKFCNLLLIVITILAVNMYWILPSLLFILKSIPQISSLGAIGFNDWIDSLSANTSIFNVMRLQGAWDWYSIDQTSGLPIYIPYALNYFHKLPFIVYSLTIPGLAILSLFFRDKLKNKLYIGFSLLMILGIFLGVGTHAPTGVIFSFLLKHLPFFSLFRSPWYIFTPLLTLAYAVLIALFLDTFLNYHWKDYRFLRTFSLIGVVLLLAGNLLYCYPLVTGKIFRPSRKDGFYLSFPDYVFEAGKWLGKHEISGRILGYPDDNIEQFTWGYRGVDSILQLISDSEILYSPLNNTTSPSAVLIGTIYEKIKKGELTAFTTLAQRLNVSAVFEKKDQNALSPKLPQAITGLESRNFGMWSFHLLPGASSPPKVFAVSNINYINNPDDFSEILAAADASTHFVYAKDSVVAEINNAYEVDGNTTAAVNLQTETYENFGLAGARSADRFTVRDVSLAGYRFSVTEKGSYQPILERYELDHFGINPKNNLTARLDGKEIILNPANLTDSYLYFNPIYLEVGDHQLSFNLDNPNLVSNGNFDDNKVTVREGYREGTFTSQVVSEAGNKYLSLTNKGKVGAAATFKVNDFNPFSLYYLEFRYRHLFGNNASVTVDQLTPTSFVKSDQKILPDYPVWSIYSFYFAPVETESIMNVLLEPLSTGEPLGTNVFYDDIVVKKVFTNNLVFLKTSKNFLSTPKVTVEKKNPVTYTGQVSGANGAHILYFAENYSSGWLISLTDNGGKRLNVSPKHFTIDSYANAWFIDGAPVNYKFRIYYWPQVLFGIGGIVFIFVFLFSGGLLLRKYWHAHH